VPHLPDLAKYKFPSGSPSNQVETLLINTYVNSEGSKHSLYRRVGVQNELSLRDIIYDDERGTAPGITTPHTLMTHKYHLHQDFVISQQVIPSKRWDIMRTIISMSGVKVAGIDSRFSCFNEDIGNLFIPTTRIDTYVNDVGGRLGLGYDS
jgi:hypothetical protein